MGWQNKIKVVGLILMLLASVTPGFLLPAKAQSVYAAYLIDPNDGMLVVNGAYTVVLSVVENGAPVADGANVTLAWDSNNSDVLAWTTTVNGFATFDNLKPTKTGILYVFVNGENTGLTLKVLSQDAINVAITPAEIYQGQVTPVVINVTVNGTPFSGAGVSITSKTLKYIDENGELKPYYYTATTGENGIATINLWTPTLDTLEVTVNVRGFEVKKSITVLPAPAEQQVQIYGWVRKFIQYYNANGEPYFEGTLERVPNAEIFVKIVAENPVENGTVLTPITEKYIYVGNSSADSGFPGEYTFNLAVAGDGQTKYHVYIVAYKPGAESTTVVQDGTYVKIAEKQKYAVPSENIESYYGYLPGHVEIVPGTTSVQANAPAILTTVREINVTLPYVKVDKVSYISPCDGQLVQQNAAHDLNSTPMLPAANGKWFDIEVTITDDQGNPYNFAKAEEEGIQFESEYVVATIDDPNLGILDVGSMNGSTVMAPIDPDTGVAKIKVWSTVPAGEVAKHINIGIANVSSVFNVKVNFASEVEPEPTAKVPEYWHINAPSDAVVYIYNYTGKTTEEIPLTDTIKINPGQRLQKIEYSLSNYTLLKFVGVGYVSSDVTDHSGEQLAGATVILQLWDNTTGKWVEAKDICGRPLEVTSADDGHYAFDDVPTTESELFRVYATKDGAEGYSWNFSIPIGTTATADVKVVGKMPAKFELSSLSVDTTSGEAPLSVTVSAVVKNTGEMSGKYRVELKVNGNTVQWTDVELSGGQSQKVEFQYTFVKPGTYSVAVGDLSLGQVTVTKPTTTTTTTTSQPTTTTTTTTSGGGGICGPAAIIGLAVVPLLLKRRK
ncbi:CGP-CTERM sorting domain-containing protein [Thermococcus waiotapuensis]|uniref:CGP-CTERM sorting domain-containing protein n=1 Tax=Thermococcus waiotapuensis TaxID=90909 RepID=A0AAE4NWR2_9EURY|nr:CGP-CTERM sorting domain-containing protein [Thermococcus waiotapuensis]MDV3104117.1 CGP-CTERM sorting domain-containing protein [Thermococcus waiotapuensis]